MAAMIRSVLAPLLLLSTFCAQAACFEQAGQRYGIAPALLKAISAVESGFNPNARNRNRDGSEDLGHMQSQQPLAGRRSSSYGIGREQLFDPCINTYVGAWILAQNISRLGYGWDAIGAYNARSPRKARGLCPGTRSATARECNEVKLPHTRGFIRDIAIAGGFIAIGILAPGSPIENGLRSPSGRHFGRPRPGLAHQVFYRSQGSSHAKQS
jgi:hypothetical protein